MNSVTIASAVIAGLSAVAAVVSGALARKQSKNAADSANEAQAEANRLSSQAASIQALDWTTQYFEGVRAWANDVTQAMTDALHLSRIKDQTEREREWNRVRSRLSASIDMGRWYFPNKYKEDYGLSKAPAYRGLRRRILDFVVAAYDALPESPGYFEPRALSDEYTLRAYGEIERAKRYFVSEVQDLLNPGHREQQVRDIIARFSVVDKMREGTDDED